MKISIFNKDIVIVLSVFALMPGGRFFRKDLKEKTRLNNVVLDNTLNILFNSGILNKQGKSITLNIENSKEIISIVKEDYKLLKEIPLNVYFSILNVVYFLSRFSFLDCYLFGSYSKLVYKENSDIDMAIISDSFNDKSRKALHLLVSKIGKQYGKEVEIHYFKKDFYKNKKDLLVKDILKHGVKVI